MNYAVGAAAAARESDVGKRLTRAAIADLAIIGAAFAIGLVFGPIGIMGFFLMIVAMLIATAVLLATPTSRAADVRAAAPDRPQGAARADRPLARRATPGAARAGDQRGRCDRREARTR